MSEVSNCLKKSELARLITRTLSGICFINLARQQTKPGPTTISLLIISSFLFFFLKSQLLLFRPNTSGMFPLTISRFGGVIYLVIRILSVLSSLSGDRLTRSWLKAWSLSSVPHSTSLSTWRHGPAGSFCCHNKSHPDRIQYNHGGVPFHQASAQHFYTPGGATHHNCVRGRTAALDGWLERNNPWEIIYKESLMVYVASLLLYTMIYCTASSLLFLNLPSALITDGMNEMPLRESKSVLYLNMWLIP